MTTKTTNPTIVHFHIGRGGRFNNAGHKKFCGKKTISEVISIADGSGQWSFLNPEENAHIDVNGNELITVAEVETGVGRIEWDGDYDTDICKLISDCDESELQLIAKEDTALVQQFFDENTDLAIDWKKFDGDYPGLIDSYFNNPSFDIEDFYETEEEEA